MGTAVIRRSAFVMCVAILLAGVAARPAAAQCSGIVPSAPASYTGAAPSNCMEVYRVFLPTGTAPAGGWPVLIHFELSGFSVSVDFPTLDPNSFLCKVLQQHVAVVTARATTSLNQPLVCGGPVIVGKGSFHPPGLGTVGSAAYADPTYAMPEKDAVMIIQHVRFNAGKPGPLRFINGSKVAVHGASAGAISLAWACLGPDRSTEQPFASFWAQPGNPPTQFQEDTRPDVAVLWGATFWWPIFNTNITAGTSHFGFDGALEQLATNLGQASPTELQAASALWYETCLPADPSMPVLLLQDHASVCEDYTKNTSPCSRSTVYSPPFTFDFCFDGGGDEGIAPGGSGLHPAWAGYVWKNLHPASARVIVSDVPAFAQAHGVEAESVSSAAVMDDVAAAWVAEQLNALPRRSFLYEQYRPTPTSLPETIGVPGQLDVWPGLGVMPQLKANGPMQGMGNTVELSRCRDSAQSTLLYLFVGFDAAPVQTLSRWLIPQQTGIGPYLLTLAPHQTVLTLNIDQLIANLGPGADAWLQVFVADSSAPQGASSTNAVQVVKPN